MVLTVAVVLTAADMVGAGLGTTSGLDWVDAGSDGSGGTGT